mmetsp:Transcript_11302/g.47210  ORF Transcript_11302/g.47210 Transcript_11302/m.47210 type:complete len:257 (-) Transcript_11302:1181-1951(-)
MIAWPQSGAVRIMCSTRSYWRFTSASLKMYSVGSICNVRFLPSRSRQHTASPDTRVRYTGFSSVRMMPLSPLGRQYLTWFSVVYTKTPHSSHAPDLTRMVSCTVHRCSSLRLAMMTVCLDSSATCDMSAFHTTYLTKGVASSAVTVRCCTSNSATRSSERSNSEPVPAKKIASSEGTCGVHFLVTSFLRFLMRISLCALSSTAKRLRAMNTAPWPWPRSDTLGSARPPLPSRGMTTSSYEPPSASELTSTAFSAGL